MKREDVEIHEKNYKRLDLRFVPEDRSQRDAPFDADGPRLRGARMFLFRDRKGLAESGVREFRTTSGVDGEGKVFAKRPGLPSLAEKIGERKKSRAGEGFAADQDFVTWAEARANKPSLAGLELVRASGSSQFTASGLRWLLRHSALAGAEVVVVDLRQEPHVLLDARTATWIAEEDIKDHALLGASREAAKEAEAALIEHLRGSSAWARGDWRARAGALALAIGVPDVYFLRHLHEALVAAAEALAEGRCDADEQYDNLDTVLRAAGVEDVEAARLELLARRDELGALQAAEQEAGLRVPLHYKLDSDARAAVDEEQKALEKARWPLWGARKSARVHSVLSEEELIAWVIGPPERHYLRLYVPDHEIPERDQDVDDFVARVLASPNAWFHLHCRGGKGRTTTFLCMIDALRTMHVDGLEPLDILYRQWMLGGSDLDSTREKVVEEAGEAVARGASEADGVSHGLDSSYKMRPALDRAEFVRRFVEYARTTRGKISWSQWAQKNGHSLDVPANRMLMADYPRVTVAK